MVISVQPVCILTLMEYFVLMQVLNIVDVPMWKDSPKA